MNPQPQQVPAQLSPQKPDKENVYISFSWWIDGETVWAIISAVTQVMWQFNVQKISFLLSSPWGSVRDGITLYNFLKSIYPRIVMYNTWAIDSIANVIFLAWEERYAYPHTSFLFHGVKIWLWPNQWLTLNQIKEMESSMSIDQQKIAWIIADNSQFTEDQILEMYNTGQSIDSQKALDKGIISDVWSASISQDDLLITINGK